MIEPGQTFAARYRVLRCIAEGGMGAIFEAEHLATERRVALKLLFPHIMNVGSARQKFELEAKISARVNSPYIVEVLDAGFDEASKSPYLVMELLEGETLAERVIQRGPLPADEALRLLEQVAAGLDAAHGYKEPGGALKPIVHRDLKPENLFLARQHDGSVVAKILDFGIAKVLGDTTHISQEVRGTPLFMAFEQITAGALSPQTDVWALGLIAYHMLSGAPYWRSVERKGSSIQSLFAEILTLPLPPPSLRLREQNADVSLPPAFDAWLLRCIDREPSQRFSSAGAAIEALGLVFERAPRAPVEPLAPIAPPIGTKTQAFIAADAAVRAAAARAASSAAPAPSSAAPAPSSAAPAATHGSVPALSTTRHRRSLRVRVLSSPLHWAAVGAGGGVFLLGALLWLASRDLSPGHDATPAREPASAVHAARPAPDLTAAAAASAPHPPAPALDPAPAEPSTPRIRIAPIDETAGAPPAPASAGAGVAWRNPGAPSDAPAPRAPGVAPGIGVAPAPGAASGASATPAPAAGSSAASRTQSASSGGSPAASAASRAAPKQKAKRPRRSVGSGEAYRTR